MARLYSIKCPPPGELFASLSPLLAIKEKYGHRNVTFSSLIILFNNSINIFQVAFILRLILLSNKSVIR